MSVAPPRPKGPPLNALRAFEAAARLGGFAAAADELCVTPGAVAQQVKALEAWAGADLFERRPQGVRPTALGASLAADFSRAFDALGDAVLTLRSRAAPKRIHIAALPSIAQLWLSPRLPAIRRAAPELAISVTALEAPPNLKRDPFDLSIFFEPGPGGPGSVEIGRDVIFPVCAPALVARLQNHADLNGVPCLHDATWSEDWADWTSVAAPGRVTDISGPVFSLYALALEEARNGAGILIGHDALVRADLASGALVAPFPERVVLDRILSITVAKPGMGNPVRDAVVRALMAGGGG